MNQPHHASTAPDESHLSREEIALNVLSEFVAGASLDRSGFGPACGGFAPCPGRDRHSKKNGRKDFRVLLDGAPTGFCLHSSCADVVEVFNKELRRRIGRAEWIAAHGPGRSGYVMPEWASEAGIAPEPEADVQKRPKLDRVAVERFIHGSPRVDQEWLWRRSPVDPRGVSSAEFLDRIYGAGERVLIFTDHRSQGDFLYVAKGNLTTEGTEITEGGLSGGWRLSQKKGVKAVRSGLPRGAKDGVWFLVQPVSGRWEIKTGWNEQEKEREGMWTRRSQVNVSSWRFFVLESDELEPEKWLAVVVNLKLPVVALYTSGGRSIHALVRIPVGSKGEWDLVRDQVRACVCPLGADGAALSAVRLSRLPGCLRGNRLQELLWLNPGAGYEGMRLMPEVRDK